MGKALHLFILLIFVLFNSNLNSQIIDSDLNLTDESQEHIVTMNNDNIMVGIVTQITSTVVYFKFHGNIMQLNLSDVKSIEVKGNSQDSSYEIQGHESLALSQTAYNFKKKQGEYRTYYAVAHMIDFGITDNISIGGGVIIPAIAFLRAKISTNNEDNNFNIGLVFGSYFGIIDNFGFEPVIQLGTVVTIGDPTKFLNFGFGSLWPTEFPEDYLLPITIGGAMHLNSNWRLTMDNYIFVIPEYDEVTLLPTFGASWFNAKNRVDFGSGLFIDPFSGYAFPLPYITYARRF